MRFKTDENLPIQIADWVRQQGHDALSVAEQGLAGFADPAVAAVSQVEKRAIVSLDLDFSDIRRYPPENYAGIIILRPVVQMIPALERMMARAVALLSQEPLDGCLWIVDDHRVRIRDSRRPGTADP
jgi:predicted nuclease of predicted toxin-antitoxin system